MKWRQWIAIVFVPVLGTQCHTAPTGPYDPPGEASRETAAAEKLSREAADLMSKDPSEAERLLREALTKDLFFGPAHNNLGVLFLNGGKLYEAAGEFEWARKLLPGHPDPRVNLAITLERAGRTDEALTTYSAALEVCADYLPAIEGLASLTARTGKHDDRMQPWVREITMRAESATWREWATAQLALKP
jgi:tetratricopeptide (TPR) repeat protein